MGRNLQFLFIFLKSLFDKTCYGYFHTVLKQHVWNTPFYFHSLFLFLVKFVLLLAKFYWFYLAK